MEERHGGSASSKGGGARSKEVYKGSEQHKKQSKKQFRDGSPREPACEGEVGLCLWALDLKIHGLRCGPWVFNADPIIASLYCCSRRSPNLQHPKPQARRLIEFLTAPYRASLPRPGSVGPHGALLLVSKYV